MLNEISFNTLAGNVKAAGVKTSVDSMIEYSSYAENAYLVFRTRNYVSKFAEKESTPRFYFTDNGILSLFLVDKRSALLENAVAVHLRRQFGNDIYYFASKTEGNTKLVIVTLEEDKTITKDGYVIEVIPIHKFLVG